MQLRFTTELTSEEYVSREAWREARLERCPLHPHGGCSFARHGSYERVSPPGTRIPRWYCPQAHCTFSLLPDCLCARFSGTLRDLEAVVETVERAPSLEAAAGKLRLDIELPGALRWIRRRVQAVHASLAVIKGLIPDRLEACEATLSGFRRQLAVDEVLPALREIAARFVAALAPPLGFRPPCFRSGHPSSGFQQPMGPDPPQWLS